MNTKLFAPRRSVLVSMLLLASVLCDAQIVEFSDDFESGTANWTLTDLWGLSTSNSNSPTNSLTESPTGNYGDLETSYATMANPVDLSTVLDANMTFWAIYDIEGGFDYMYVEASRDGGATWDNVATFDGENNLSPWVQYSYSLGGYVGSAYVLVRFMFVSDGFVNFDGMYIDDFEITSNSIDNSPPLILHTGPVMHQATLSAQNITAQLIDISGISLAEMSYTVDGGAPQIVTGLNTSGDEYLFVLPQQPAGAWMDYWFTAIDASDSLNMAQSDTSSYISGNYISYDNAQIDFVNSYGPSSLSLLNGTAVAITLPGTTDLVTALIRNYTDVNRPNDSMLIHVWDEVGGLPGTDLITPFKVFPEATLAEPNRITRVDLRPYSSQLSNLSGNVFVGFTVPTGEVWVSQTTPGVAGRTYADDGSIWANITDDYHFRAITDTFAGAPVTDFTYNSSADPLIAFSDISTNSPTSWSWDFGDGIGTSTSQNPSYTYTANGTYNVCLTTTNSVGSSTTCQLVTVSSIATVANFTASSTSFCQGTCITFADKSTNVPLTWSWSFPGGTPATDTAKNPIICYTTPGTYDVTLIVTNGGGSDTLVQSAYITVTSCPPPVAGFTALDTSVCIGDPVTFTDKTTESPNSWVWSMPGATPDSSNLQNPTVTYAATGTYSVTLIASNTVGSDTLTKVNYITVNALPTTPTITVGGSTTICQGDSVTLTSSSPTGNMWSNGMNSQSIEATTAGGYTVTVTDGNGCSATSDTTTIAVNSAPATPIIIAGGLTSFCEGGTVVLTSNTASGNIWSTGDTTVSITVSSSASITLSVIDSIGCVSAASAATAVTMLPNPPVPGITANGNVLTSDISNTYQWYMGSTLLTGETSVDYTITQSGTYSVEVTDVNGCSTMSNPFSATYTGLEDLPGKVQFKVFPVPSEGEVHLHLDAMERGDYLIELTNVIGEVIYTERMKDFSGKFMHTLALSEYGTGVYFVRLQSSGHALTRKVIVY